VCEGRWDLTTSLTQSGTPTATATVPVPRGASDLVSGSGQTPDVRRAESWLGRLVVVSRDVGQSADGWLVADRAVEPVVIVEVQPSGQGGSAFGF